jgi:hypothetical protein
MANIYLIGTSHRYQLRARDADRDIDEFVVYLTRAATRFKVCAITEEMCLESVQQAGVAESVCQKLSQSLGIPHLYCDPDMAERAALGMDLTDPNTAASEVFLSIQGRSARRKLAEMTHARLRTLFEPREKEWLRRLKALDRFPVLFVCGANHVVAFHEIVTKSGLSINLLSKDWMPRAHVDRR